jgi:hypothetical protein
MKRVFRAGVGLVALMLLLAGQAFAAQKVTYIVLPFSVQGPQGFAYLEKSIPQMITSRIYWKDRVEPARELSPGARPVDSESEAEKLRVQYKADYVIWGSVTIVGDDASLDVQVRDKAGKVWPQTREAKAPQLISAIGAMSDAINRDVFNRATSASNRSAGSGGTAGAGRVNQMNPDIMVNENSPREVYLNPQFRYAGASQEDESRLRSQALNFPAIGMEVTDADGDGKNEIFLLDDHAVRAFRFEKNNQLKQIGEHRFSLNSQCLNIRSLPSPSGRGAWSVVTVIDQGGIPQSCVLTFNGSSFKEEMKNIRHYLNVVRMPPDYLPKIIGQEAAPPRLFRPNSLAEMIPQGGTLVSGGRLNLPPEANVFNFTWLPSSRGERDGQKLIVLTGTETLRVYNSKLSRLAETSESYSGASTGMEIDPSMPGLGRETVTMSNVFYIPMRMVPYDLERDGNWELIVNKPISTASKVFDRYRYFPQSEIHSLFWDGLGMGLQWKTRRIKGSMVDYTVADANNSGIPSLVVCVNTHPGAIGASARRAMVLLYPLDISLTAPGTVPDRSDIFDD